MWSLTGIKEHDQKPGCPEWLLHAPWVTFATAQPQSLSCIEMDVRNGLKLGRLADPSPSPSRPCSTFPGPTLFLMAPGLLCLVTHPQLDFSWNPARRMLPHLLLENFSSVPDADREAENWRFTQPTGHTL